MNYKLNIENIDMHTTLKSFQEKQKILQFMQMQTHIPLRHTSTSTSTSSSSRANTANTDKKEESNSTSTSAGAGGGGGEVEIDVGVLETEETEDVNMIDVTDLIEGPKIGGNDTYNDDDEGDSEYNGLSLSQSSLSTNTISTVTTTISTTSTSKNKKRTAEELTSVAKGQLKKRKKRGW